jgi:hypothetical protein
MDRNFKMGVSDWVITFDNYDIVKLDALTQENVVSYSDGKVYIVVVNVTYDDKLMKMLDKFSVINVNQEFELRNNLGKVVGKLNFDYKDMKIKYILNQAESSGLGIMKIVMKNF